MPDFDELIAALEAGDRSNATIERTIKALQWAMEAVAEEPRTWTIETTCPRCGAEVIQKLEPMQSEITCESCGLTFDIM